MTSRFRETGANGHGVPLPNVRLLTKPYLKDGLARVLRAVPDDHGEAD